MDNNKNRNVGSRMEEVHCGKILWYSKPRGKDSMYGLVKSNIDGSETMVDDNQLVNCSLLEEGTFILYRKGRRARSVFDLSCSAQENQMNKYWEMLVMLAKCKNDPRYSQLIQIARKFFASSRDRVDFLRCFLRRGNPFLKLPENFLMYYPDCFNEASTVQQLYLYRHDKALFGTCLEKADPYLQGRIVRNFPDDFLLSFPNYFDIADIRQQRCLYIEKPELFAHYWECWKERNSARLKYTLGSIVPEFPTDFLLKFPDCFDAASPEQKRFFSSMYKEQRELFLELLGKQELSLQEKIISYWLPDDFLIGNLAYFGLARCAQRLRLLETDERIWAAELEKLPEEQRAQVTLMLPAEYLEKYLQFAIQIPNLQLRLKVAENHDITREEERELTYLLAKARGIRYLVHFTLVKNLKGILKDGKMVTRAKLESRADNTAVFTDPQRLDNVGDSLSLSVSFPNSPMFYVKRQQLTCQTTVGWCVLLLNVELLRDFNCLFNKENAASNPCRYLSWEERMSLRAFATMFEDDYKPDELSGSRGHLKSIDENPCDIYATHPQAEILCLSDIPIRYIERCCFPPLRLTSGIIRSGTNIECANIKSEMDPMLAECGIESVFEDKYFGDGPYSSPYYG